MRAVRERFEVFVSGSPSPSTSPGHAVRAPGTSSSAYVPDGGVGEGWLGGRVNGGGCDQFGRGGSQRCVVVNQFSSAIRGRVPNGVHHTFT